MNPRTNSKFSLQRLDFRGAVLGLRKVKPEPEHLKTEKSKKSWKSLLPRLHRSVESTPNRESGFPETFQLVS
jgi:hypothetical protein